MGVATGPRLPPMVGLNRGLAASGTAVIAFFVAVVLPSSTWPLIDGDVWWHLRAGGEVLATGAVPGTDTWSILGQGRPWISQDWAANTAMAAIMAVGPAGATALSVGFGLVVVAAFAVLWRTIGIRNPAVRWASRIVWLTGGLVLAAPILGVRVQVVDLVLSAVVVWLVAHYMVDRRRTWLLGFPLVAVLWANLHAGWPLLFLLGGAVVVGEAVDHAWRRAVVPEPLDTARIRDLGLALVGAFAALALNPSGTALWVYPLQTVNIAVLGRHILEWFPVTADPRLLGLYVVFVGIVVIPTLALGRHTLRLADALTIIGLTIMAAYAVRFLLIAGPLVAALAAINLTPRLAASRLGRWAQPVVDELSVPRGGRLGLAHLGLAAALVLLGVGVSLVKVVPPAQMAAARAQFPVAAVAWVAEHGASQRAFNRYEWGGYLGYALPDRLVFLDGRADVYGDDRLLLYAAVIGVRADPQAVFDQYQVDYVLFSPDGALADWLNASPAWERAYVDDVAAVWVRR